MTTKEHSHEYYLKNKDRWVALYEIQKKERAKGGKYYEKHKEVVSHYQKRNRKKMTDCTREWRKKNPEKTKLQQRRNDKTRENSLIRKEWKRKYYYTGNKNQYMKEWAKRNPLKWRAYGYKRKMLTKDLTLEIVQQVYEGNVKKYGTLTCYLCLKPVIFGNDCLEHKTPLSRGGSNLKDNLDVAHRVCNVRKHSMTELEYREVQSQST